MSQVRCSGIFFSWEWVDNGYFTCNSLLLFSALVAVRKHNRYLDTSEYNLYNIIYRYVLVYICTICHALRTIHSNSAHACVLSCVVATFLEAGWLTTHYQISSLLCSSGQSNLGALTYQGNYVYTCDVCCALDPHLSEWMHMGHIRVQMIIR